MAKVKLRQTSREVILIMDAKDFTYSYTSELLATLEGCQQINFGDHLNFSTNIRFEGERQSRVIFAFNQIVQRLGVDRIIINNI